jgi:hypothetical protein
MGHLSRERIESVSLFVERITMNSIDSDGRNSKRDTDSTERRKRRRIGHASKCWRLRMSNWTEAQLKEHYERVKGGDANCQGIVESQVNPSGSAAPSRVSGGARMNKLEAAYAQQLERDRRAGLIMSWHFEPVKFRLANKTTYTPDFMITRTYELRAYWLNGIEFHETKGFWREDARVKIKVAAEIFPMFKFLGITKKRVRDGGGWNVEEF